MVIERKHLKSKTINSIVIHFVHTHTNDQWGYTRDQNNSLIEVPTSAASGDTANMYECFRKTTSQALGIEADQSKAFRRKLQNKSAILFY